MKKQTLTNKIVSNKTINNNTKGINTMKKLIVATCLMVGAAFASFAAVQYDYNPGAVTYNQFGPYQYSFTFEEAGKYDLIAQPGPSVTAFGYFFIDDPDTLIAAQYGGNFYTAEDFTYDTYFLGYFNAGDQIGLWYQSGMVVNTIIGPANTKIEEWDGLNWVLIGGSNFSFNEVSGSPLPGVWAALAIGGCAFFGRKIRSRALRGS